MYTVEEVVDNYIENVLKPRLEQDVANFSSPEVQEEEVPLAIPGTDSNDVLNF